MAVKNPNRKFAHTVGIKEEIFVQEVSSPDRIRGTSSVPPTKMFEFQRTISVDPLFALFEPLKTLPDLTVSLILGGIPLCGAVLALYLNYQKWRASPFRGLPYPPGPPLMLGRSMDAMQSYAYLAYANLAKKYGDVMYLNIYGEHSVILNSYEDAVELLERRARYYSSRQNNEPINMMGWDFNAGFLPYGNEWRRHRKLFQQCFRPQASSKYVPIQTEKIQHLLYDLLTTPTDFLTHCKSAATTMIMCLLYGYELDEQKVKYFVSLAEGSVGELGLALRPGATIVTYVPILRHLPPWFPGASFKRQAMKVKHLTTQMQEVPMDFVAKGLLKGTSSPSLVSDLLENCYMERDYKLIKAVAATSFAAASDTTVASMESFLLAMSLSPYAQKKAQEEIDRVTGSKRLPMIDDRGALPYVEAVYRELMRWAPIVPLNTAHTTTEDDIYKGYYIPRGTSVYANTWAMTRDETKYPNPEHFNPDRHFNEDGKLNDDPVLTFGFGRRICPGRHFASTTIWFTIASILAAFDITATKKQEHTPLSTKEMFQDGFVSHPLPFECKIAPRRDNTATLIREAVGRK